MKTIKNTSLQGISLNLTGAQGVKTVYLMPKQSVKVSNDWGGKILENLVSRRMVKVVRTADPAPKKVTPPPVKQTRKSKGSI